MEHGSSKQNVGFILQSIRAFCTEKEVITMYSKEAFIRDCVAIFAKTEGNTVEIPGVGSIVLFDEPLIGFADAEDALFESYRQPEIIGTNFMSPKEWLPAAGTVVSFFLPFTEAVRRSNRADRTDPSPEWLYGRIEGQAFISRFTAGLKKMLKERRTECCVPSLDERFGIRFEAAFTGEKPDFHADGRWSERHAAYACGLGTFSLSRGLISEKGIAGRYASLIVSETWPATVRDYTGVDDYCIKCGACARNCPAQAITVEHGKNNVLCKAQVDRMQEKYSPRYGCGKCQVNVPCEFRVPGKRPRAERAGKAP